MPSRRNRNATRHSPNLTPNTHLQHLFPEFDSPSPALPVVDLPAVDPVHLLREPGIEHVAEQDLIDIHGTSGRVRGDRESPSPLVPSSPPMVAFRISDQPDVPDTGADLLEPGHVRSPVLAR